MDRSGAAVGPTPRRYPEAVGFEGPAAPEIAILFSAGPIDAIALDGPAP
jgi:hypothetical protein